MSMSGVRVSLTREEDKHLPAFDYTKLTSINTCPRWGLVTHEAHKRMPGRGRSTALECGAACHEVFAAIRLWQLGNVQRKPGLMERRGLELYTPARWAQMMHTQDFNSNSPSTNMMHFALEALYTSGYYDDPNDRRRTLTNMEESLIAYCDRWDCERFPIYISPDEQFIGIEVGFDLTLDFNGDRLRYTGRMDGLHWDGSDDVIVPHENKTAARIDESWLASFQMSHQVTGYTVAASVLAQRPCSTAIVYGLTIPLPKRADYGGYVREHVQRHPHLIGQWAAWVWDTFQVWKQHRAEPLLAPTYTHSCNRYFHSCSLLPLCTAKPDDARHMFDVEMEHEEWNPLAERAT